MKYTLFGIVVLLLGALHFFGAQINTIYICKRSSSILHETKSIPSPHKRLTIRTMKITNSVYSPTVAKLFLEVSKATASDRSAVFQAELEKIMGVGYTCPTLMELLVEKQ